jgi:hypothetical protein
MSSRLRSGAEDGIAPALGAVDDKLPPLSFRDYSGLRPNTSRETLHRCVIDIKVMTPIPHSE